MSDSLLLSVASPVTEYRSDTLRRFDSIKCCLRVYRRVIVGSPRSRRGEWTRLCIRRGFSYRGGSSAITGLMDYIGVHSSR